MYYQCILRLNYFHYWTILAVRIICMKAQAGGRLTCIPFVYSFISIIIIHDCFIIIYEIALKTNLVAHPLPYLCFVFVRLCLDVAIVA